MGARYLFQLAGIRVWHMVPLMNEPTFKLPALGLGFIGLTWTKISV
jgi:hypothetical protein